MADDGDLGCAVARDGSLDGGQDGGSSPELTIRMSPRCDALGLEVGKTYLACSLPKPLCTLMEELTPGNKEESRLSKTALASVAMASLQEVVSFLRPEGTCVMLAYIFPGSVPWWATMTEPWAGE